MATQHAWQINTRAKSTLGWLTLFVRHGDSNAMAIPDTQPVATYRERIRCLIHRTFELYRDRVRVHGTSRGSKFDSIILLKDLAGSPNRVWLRSKHYHWASLTVAILSVFLIVPFLTWPPDLLFLVPGIVIFIPGLIYLLRSLKRNEYLQYKNCHGIVILDLGRVGPDAESFSDFSDALDRAIENVSNNRMHTEPAAGSESNG